MAKYIFYQTTDGRMVPYEYVKFIHFDETKIGVEDISKILEEIMNFSYIQYLHHPEEPAIETIDHKIWYLNGLKHNEAGPALYDKRSKRYEFYLNDIRYSLADWLENNPSLSDDEKIAYKLGDKHIEYIEKWCE